MKRIEKNIDPVHFQAIIDGRKKYELRLADFDCEIGDVLVLKEWNRKIKIYTGREIEKKITYITRTKELPYWTPEEVNEHGYQVIGFN